MAKRMHSNNEMTPGAAHAACADWGALLPDAAEDLLSETEERALDLHVSGCTACAHELSHARQGAAWLSLLKGHTPEPPTDMVEGILARTTGAGTLPAAVALTASQSLPSLEPATEFRSALPQPNVTPAWFFQADRTTAPAADSLRSRVARWLGLDSGYLFAVQPRLTMTAAMAFLSVCLTLNLFGISVTQLHAEDLHTAALQRSVAGRGASLLRSFEGIRVVYRVESRVNNWLTASAAPDNRPPGTERQ